MKKLYKLLYVLIVPGILVLYSYHTGSPGGKTGSPGDNGVTCTQCHNSFSAQEQPGWITSTIPADGYTPGETYTITATGTYAGVVRFGFELTAEDDAGNKTGTFIITDAVRTQMSPTNASVTHTANGITPSGDSNTWSMDWTAPDAGEGTVTFYAAFNAANGNGNTGGDHIFTSSLSVNESVPQPVITSVDPDHAEQSWEGDITILGENTTWGSGVFAVTFKFHDDNQISFSASSIDVHSDTELVATVSIPSDQTIGDYDVFVDNVSIENGFRVDITSGIENNALEKSITVYPNPAKDFIYLRLPVGAEFSIFNLIGNEVMHQQVSGTNERLNVSSLENGIYFIRVMKNEKTATVRLLKN